MNNAEEWEKIIFSMPEQIFFDLARNYLGNIKTPFNKHALVEKLEHFLLKKETVEKIISMIDLKDAQILSAVSLLKNGSAEELYELFRAEQAYYEFYSKLLNLEERMLICSVKENGGKLQIILSPLFRNIIEDEIADYSLIINCRPWEPVKRGHLSWDNGGMQAAFLSYMLKNGNILKNDQNFKKKYEDEIRKTFKPVSGKRDPLQYAEIMKEIFIKASLIEISEKKIIPSLKNLSKLAQLPADIRRAYLIKIYMFGCADHEQKSESRFTACFLKNIRTDKIYSGDSLKKLIKCCAIISKFEYPEEEGNSIEERFLKSGIIEKNEKGYFVPEEQDLPENSRKKIVIQSNFSLFADSSLPLKESFFLALCADIMETGYICRYEITKESFTRALRAGKTREEITAFLEEESYAKLPQNIIFSMKTWEEEYNSIAIYHGFVIKADKRKQLILENTPDFLKGTTKRLGEGIYFIPPENFSSKLKTLKSALETEISPPYIEKEGETVKAGEISELKNAEIFSHLFKNRKNSSKQEENSDLYSKKIESLDILPEQKETLLDRVKRKLILSEEQLNAGAAKYEKNEVRGIDYTGKLRLCEQVIKAGNYFLKISENPWRPESSGSLIKPERLIKIEEEIFIEGIEIPEGNRIRISLRKAFLIKKIRTSLAR